MSLRRRGTRTRGWSMLAGVVCASVALAGCVPDGAPPDPDPSSGPSTSAGPYPVGVAWDGPVEVLSERTGISGTGWHDLARFEHVGDELWVLGAQHNGPMAARSTDEGATWSEVRIASARAGERLTVDQVLPGVGGGYLAIATVLTRCVGGGPDSAQTAVCQRLRPVVYTSPDAASWAEVAPPAWSPGAEESLTIQSVVATDSGFIAAGTIRGPQWRAVLYSSTDGTDWILERELSGAAGPLTSVQLAHDGTTLTYIAYETACENHFDGPGGWVLGSFWAQHGRIFVGTDIASLALQAPGEHPLAPEPLAAPEGCSFESVPYAAVPYPQFQVKLIGGVTTVFEDFVPPEQQELVENADSDRAAEVRATSGTRRYAQLRDGVWTLIEIGQATVPEDAVSFFDYAGSPAFAEVVTVRTVLQQVFSVIDGVQHESVQHPLLARARDVTAVGDALLLLGVEWREPFAPAAAASSARMVVWRSAAGEGAAPCDLVAGGVCRYADLTAHPDYPDFAGRDLAGVDLTATELGSSDFDGADLHGARLWLASADAPSFVGADLTGAQLQGARVGDISGATVHGADFTDATILHARGVDFSGTVVYRADLGDLTGVGFGDADWTRATLRVVDAFPDLSAVAYERITVRVRPPEGVVVELDLSGADLTGVRLSGTFGEHLVITSLTGAILDDTVFSEVDLSRVDPAVDLSGLEVVESSTICPDGRPPTGGYFGTCVR